MKCDNLNEMKSCKRLQMPFEKSKFTIKLGLSIIRRKIDWRENKKETKLVALENKKRKNTAQIQLVGPNRAQNFLNF